MAKTITRTAAHEQCGYRTYTRKIGDDPARPAFIVTVRGTGYRFEDAAL